MRIISPVPPKLHSSEGGGLGTRGSGLGTRDSGFSASMDKGYRRSVTAQVIRRILDSAESLMVASNGSRSLRGHLPYDRAVRVLCLFLALSGIAVSAQHTSRTPPIPPQERFVARNDLEGTLRASSSAVVAGQTVTLSMVLVNTGTNRLRVNGSASVTKLVSTATGTEFDMSGCIVYNT